ncbi:hypothetical protein EGW08_017391, partial [Elysia chlorotica]
FDVYIVVDFINAGKPLRGWQLEARTELGRCKFIVLSYFRVLCLTGHNQCWDFAVDEMFLNTHQVHPSTEFKTARVGNIVDQTSNITIQLCGRQHLTHHHVHFMKLSRHTAKQEHIFVLAIHLHCVDCKVGQVLPVQCSNIPQIPLQQALQK